MNTDKKLEITLLKSRTQNGDVTASSLDANGMRVVRGRCSGLRQRSYTDPTDLLAVFRRRINTTLELEENHNFTCHHECEKDSMKRSVDLRGLLQDERFQGLLHKWSNESLHSKGIKSRNNMSGEAKDSNMLPVERHERKISAPAVRIGRRNSQVLAQVHAQRRSSVAGVPRRMGRRGSEVPALASIARRRSTLTPAYPVGLKGRGARGFSNTEFHLNNIRVKAKHEMLANLVLPAFNENTFRSRERRTTCSCHPATVISKKDEKRLQVTNEILETEKKYLACLNTLKKIFEDPLREESILGTKDIDIIFPNELSLIRDSHTLFMKELEDRIENWKQYGIVGDIFTKLSSSYHIDVLKIYSDYVNNFPKAMAVINKYSRGSQKFRRFLQNCSSDPECEGLDLAAYLLTPIQRLPRYVLLLRQLSKCTDSTHPDSFHLENALETMKNMINILNDSIHNSCRIVSTSISRKSVKRRSTRKRGSLKELKITKDDNDNRVVQVSSPTDSNNGKSPVSVASSLPTESPNSLPSSPKSLASPDRLSPNSEHSILTRLRSGDKKSRPVSTGDLDRFYDTDQTKEFNAIVEEADAGKDDKSTGQSKLKSAAESVKRSWQRRSKKWRRSFEGKAVSTNTLPELEKERGSNLVFTRSGNKFTFDSSDTNLSPTISPASTPISGSTDGLKVIAACNPCLQANSMPASLNPSPAISTSEIIETVAGIYSKEESESIKNHDVVTINEQEMLVLQTYPNQGSPYARRERKQGIQERPISVALPMKGELNENIVSEDKSKSDNDLLKDDAPVWIHRQQPRLQKRHSDGALRHHLFGRTPSSVSCTSGTTGTSIGSLDTSKDSLIDSGVSGDITENSPINTLKKNENTNNFRHLSVEERLVFDEVIASGFKGASEKKMESEEQLDEKPLKSKKKFKDVVKYMFSKSKRKTSSGSLDDSVHKSKPKILSRAKSFTRESRERVPSL
ncbi:uncharacterized protein LOC110231235 isoform X3 [Exaiptasia diaphana]|uniref:DH domain-containing protein n=1 Tax=Exaiptasia diaphana TaxID=2652724 RepID=A0A913YDA9_EXADI|nr:uncharacterized protein LOC110231235 isoform X3 [Exaiptasia diaphana]